MDASESLPHVCFPRHMVSSSNVKSNVGAHRVLLLRRLLHDARAQGAHQESHKDTGEYLKAMVFGGLDGILTSFAIVAGSAGERTPRLGVEVSLALRNRCLVCAVSSLAGCSSFIHAEY